jgi:hypothetical protein
MATKLHPTFEVDKKGMSMVFARKGKGFIVSELVQNAWDEDTTRVDVTLEAGKAASKGEYRLRVEDDNPEGFADLAHAYTLFAKSAKKNDPTKRGRFNLGEKLVIAVCDEAMIKTTKGTVVFTDAGRSHSKAGTTSGSVFTGILTLTDAEVKDIEQAIRSLIPPTGITTSFNGEEVIAREPLRTFPVTLKTEVSDEDGNLKRTTRKTEVKVYEPLDGETPSLYEMGIPVVELDDRFHVSIEQKIPLNTDRDNVPPGYLRDVRVAVLNNCHDLLVDADTHQDWVTDAMGAPKALPEAVATAFHGRFGDKAVIYDPSDREANAIAVEQGFTVVPGGALPKPAWGNVKGFDIALPAGHVTPSPSVDLADGEEVDPDEWGDAVHEVAEYAKRLAAALMGRSINVKLTNDAQASTAACYGAATLTFNVGRLGKRWFEDRTPEGRAKITDLIIHEFGHEYEPNHLDRRYLDALTRMAGKAVELALSNPEVFDLKAKVPA